MLDQPTLPRLCGDRLDSNRPPSVGRESLQRQWLGGRFGLGWLSFGVGQGLRRADYSVIRLDRKRISPGWLLELSDADHEVESEKSWWGL